jgi:hypothetical protein
MKDDSHRVEHNTHMQCWFNARHMSGLCRKSLPLFVVCLSRIERAVHGSALAPMLTREFADHLNPMMQQMVTLIDLTSRPDLSGLASKPPCRDSVQRNKNRALHTDFHCHSPRKATDFHNLAFFYVGELPSCSFVPQKCLNSRPENHKIDCSDLLPVADMLLKGHLLPFV